MANIMLGKTPSSTRMTPICSSLTLNSYPRSLIKPATSRSSVLHVLSKSSTTFGGVSFSCRNRGANVTSSGWTVYAASPSATVGDSDCVEDPATNVKFRSSVCSPGGSTSLSLIGTGFREKVFAIIGVKVYAAGFYINKTILSALNAESTGDSSLFTSIFEAPGEKLIQIVFVRDVDGITFWDALDGAITPRVKDPDAADESAISTFRGIFQGKEFKKGTSVFLTWVDSSRMLVSISSSGMPEDVDASIESRKVSSALYDVYFGDAPVSPSLKLSVASGFASLLK